MSPLLFLAIWVTTISVSRSRVGFKKDQTLDLIEFPPAPQRPIDGVPVGHLRPLGWQRRPDGQIISVEKMPSPRSFYDAYVNTQSALVMLAGAAGTPAISAWTDDEYLRRKYGALDVLVVVKKAELNSTRTVGMSFEKFLGEYEYEDWYLSNLTPQPMMQELLLPGCLSCGFRSALLESHLWMSSGGTSSLLHAHADHHVHCVLSGRKHFIVIEPRFADKLNFSSPGPWQGEGHANLDVDMVNLFEHPEAGHVHWQWSSLGAGDCIFVPARYLHHVRSFGRSFSATFLWAPAPEVEFSDCDRDGHVVGNVALSHVGFVWGFHNGRQILTNSRLRAPSLRHHLLLLFKDAEWLTFDVFRSFYHRVVSGNKWASSAEIVWSLMAEKRRKLSRGNVFTLSDDVLEEVAGYLNRRGDEQRDEQRDEL